MNKCNNYQCRFGNITNSRNVYLFHNWPQCIPPHKCMCTDSTCLGTFLHSGMDCCRTHLCLKLQVHVYSSLSEIIGTTSQITGICIVSDLWWRRDSPTVWTQTADVFADTWLLKNSVYPILAKAADWLMLHTQLLLRETAQIVHCRYLPLPLPNWR